VTDLDFTSPEWTAALSRFRSRTALTDEDVTDLFASADSRPELEAKIRILSSMGRLPDASGWQAFESEFNAVSGFAAKIAPILSVAGAIATL
jgi:hypothetical protein